MKRLASGVAGEVETSASAARRRAKKKQGELVVLSVAGLALVGAVAAGIWWITREAPAPVAKHPVVPGVAPIIPESTSAAATDIAKIYREARAAVEAREFDLAAAAFVKLREDPTVQEPTRTWAGVEAVVARYLAGNSSEARKEAKDTAAHASTVEEGSPRIGEILSGMLGKLAQLPAIPAKELKTSESDASHVVAWMLAGLKNWEQGMLDEAAGYFSAVAAVKISTDEPWLAIYQNFARDYLADHESLSAGVFGQLPEDVAGCEAAVAELDALLGKLKTRGRAKYNVRAWQLDLARQAKLLAAAKPVEPAPVVPVVTEWDPVAAMAKVDGLSKDCRFAEAAEYLKSFSDAPPDATRDSLLTLTEAAAVFLADLKEDLVKQQMTGGFALRSGEIVRMIAVDAAGNLVVTDSAMQRRPAQWCGVFRGRAHRAAPDFREESEKRTGAPAPPRMRDFLRLAGR